jgi:hypothetical protein
VWHAMHWLFLASQRGLPGAAAQSLFMRQLVCDGGVPPSASPPSTATPPCAPGEPPDAVVEVAPPPPAAIVPPELLVSPPLPVGPPPPPGVSPPVSSPPVSSPPILPPLEPLEPIAPPVLASTSICRLGKLKFVAESVPHASARVMPANTPTAVLDVRMSNICILIA